MNRDELKNLWRKVYPNIPLGERRMPIYVSKEFGPMSWLVLAVEVETDTEVASEALEFLHRENII